MKNLLKNKKVVAYICLVLLVTGIVGVITIGVTTSQTELQKTLEVLEKHKKGEDIVKRELSYLTAVKDEVTWQSSRNNSTMDDGLKTIVYGNKAEDFGMMIRGYTISEILYTEKDGDEIHYLVRLVKDNSIKSFYISTNDIGITRFNAY